MPITIHSATNTGRTVNLDISCDVVGAVLLQLDAYYVQGAADPTYLASLGDVNSCAVGSHVAGTVEMADAWGEYVQVAVTALDSESNILGEAVLSPIVTIPLPEANTVTIDNVVVGAETVTADITFTNRRAADTVTGQLSIYDSGEESSYIDLSTEQAGTPQTITHTKSGTFVDPARLTFNIQFTNNALQESYGIDLTNITTGYTWTNGEPDPPAGGNVMTVKGVGAGVIRIKTAEGSVTGEPMVKGAA